MTPDDPASRPLVTLFTVPRSFEGEVAHRQRNAILSWRSLGDEIEIMLCGQDSGLADAAAAVGGVHVPDVRLSAMGTPMVDSVLSAAAAKARARLICYINADIILMPDFLESVRRVHCRRFLIVGQRWDLEIADELTFDDAGLASLRKAVAEDAVLHPPAGSDYFVYPRDLNWNAPPFVIGRVAWDNWMIYRARAMHVPVIDATLCITAIHQNHDYSHIPARRGEHWNPESDTNLELVSPDRVFDLLDATHELTPTRLRIQLNRSHLRRRVRRMNVLHPRLSSALQQISRLRKAVTGARGTGRQ